MPHQRIVTLVLHAAILLYAQQLDVHDPVSFSCAAELE